MSKFVELPDSDVGTSPRSDPIMEMNTDDETISLASQDLELQQVGNNHNRGQKIKGFIKQKKAQMAEFNPRQFVQEAKHEMQAFSLEEFMSDKRKVLIKAAAGEFLVTTLFLFIVCAVALNVDRNNHADSESMVVGALATGFSAVALIYSFADVSGAHFNPAVTFATIVTRKTSLAKGAVYMLMQVMASLFAMLLLVIVYPPKDKSNMSVVAELVVRPPNVNTALDVFRAFLLEIILTFILVYVIFAVAFDTVENNTTVRLVDEKGNAVDSKHQKNLTIYTTSGSSKAGFAPLSIGLTLGFLCFIGGSVSGGAFNPARVFGPGICAGKWDYMWLYWGGDFIGAALAGLVQQRFFATQVAAKQETPATTSA